MTQFSIPVQDLPDGEFSRRFDVSPEWLAQTLGDVDGITGDQKGGALQVTLDKNGVKVLLQGDLEAALLVNCVRCLEPFVLPIAIPVAVLFRPGTGAPEQERGEQTLDDLGEEYYQGSDIVLDDLVRDLLLLEVPMNPHCGEGCPGWSGLAETKESKEISS